MFVSGKKDMNLDYIHYEFMVQLYITNIFSFSSDGYCIFVINYDNNISILLILSLKYDFVGVKFSYLGLTAILLI